MSIAAFIKRGKKTLQPFLKMMVQTSQAYYHDAMPTLQNAAIENAVIAQIDLYLRFQELQPCFKNAPIDLFFVMTKGK